MILGASQLGTTTLGGITGIIKNFVSKVFQSAYDQSGFVSRITLLAKDQISFISKVTLLAQDTRNFISRATSFTFEILGLAAAAARIKAVVKSVKTRFRVKQ